MALFRVVHWLPFHSSIGQTRINNTTGIETRYLHIQRRTSIAWINSNGPVVLESTLASALLLAVFALSTHSTNSTLDGLTSYRLKFLSASKKSARETGCAPKSEMEARTIWST